MSKTNLFVLTVFMVVALLFAVALASAQPYGASVNSFNVSRAPADAAGSDSNAWAGNVTGLNINGASITASWQGYFGNITGTIQLADASDRVLYNWSNANPDGEIYSSRNNTITWASTQCFNFTANGTRLTTAVGESAGGTNHGGWNVTQLESAYNIGVDDVDGVNETFVFTDHDQFFTANLQFAANECRSTRVFSNSGQGVDQQFEEVLLYEPATTSIIFASLIENSLAGFDTAQHDFEMLVLEDGHGVDVASSTYYFFVELS